MGRGNQRRNFFVEFCPWNGRLINVARYFYGKAPLLRRPHECFAVRSMVVRSHDLPGESLSESLRAIAKSDALSTVERAELIEVGGELINTLGVVLL